MIVEMVLFKVDPKLSRKELIEDARHVIPRWQSFPNLMRKHFVLGENGTCAGIYVWKSKEDALEGHNAEWIENFRKRTGQEPEFQYYDAFMILDNEKGNVTEYPDAEKL